MPKYSKSSKKSIIEEARKLYAAGTELDVCAKYLAIAPATLREWAKTNGFDNARKAYLMQRPQILSAIVESFQSVLQGEKPKITADQAVKYASSFEKLSEKKKLAGYTFEAFEALTRQLLDMVGLAKKKTEKEQILASAKTCRIAMDAVIDKMVKEAFDE